MGKSNTYYTFVKEEDELRSRINVMLLLLLLVLLTTSCSSAVGSKELKGQVNVIEQALIAEEWEALSLQMDRLASIYDRNEWKLQLLGDEGEYERLHESINRLRVSIEAKDAHSASLELATVKSIVEDIYSL
jgi:hypothetical protein